MTKSMLAKGMVVMGERIRVGGKTTELTGV
jgi:hypothetical protein